MLKLMISLSLTLLIVGCSGGTYFNDASIYGGIEDPTQNSPMCSDRKGDQTTSNLGWKFNVFQSEDEKFRTNAKYTHKSCVFADDGESYDAVGVEFEYKLWSR